MASNYTSPFASAFKSACNRGTSWTTAVENIAKRNNKTTTFVWNSLFKAGIVNRQKFNGQWIYWPCNYAKKANATNCKNAQFNMWQWFCEWTIMNGFATPDQFINNKGSQKEFMTWCRKFFAKQFNTTNSTKSGRTTTRKGVKRTTKSKSYKFPTSRKNTTTRRYRRAA